MQASTADDWRNLPLAKANPAASKDVILSLPEKVQQSDAYIDSSYTPGDTVHYPDGSLVEGQDLSTTEAKRAVEAAALCSGNLAAGSYGSFGPEAVCRSTVWGKRGYRHTYSWGVGSLNTAVCMKGRGYYFDRNGTPVKTMYNIGCALWNSGVSVKWGNVIGNPSARGASQGLAQTVPWQG
ncbi:hypothetical protein [Isoptericola chiayiensis]|uniref:hypothetical protein n=1 Tax=Isoptericola chiayiensis TaxID=579446 RepID=UPI001554701C|nr:hypothetical protein [Isoptericola chiayiensis]NOW00422.1 hypothetical protein [Isoptericola chiayiensis]